MKPNSSVDRQVRPRRNRANQLSGRSVAKIMVRRQFHQRGSRARPTAPKQPADGAELIIPREGHIAEGGHRVPHADPDFGDVLPVNQTVPFSQMGLPQPIERTSTPRTSAVTFTEEELRRTLCKEFGFEEGNLMDTAHPELPAVDAAGNRLARESPRERVLVGGSSSIDKDVGESQLWRMVLSDLDELNLY